VEAANIPFTYICCNSIAGWPYFYHTHPSELPPPTEQFEIYGDGNVKGITPIFFVKSDYLFIAQD
jgi:leucoanthocyanidin reductase